MKHLRIIASIPLVLLCAAASAQASAVLPLPAAELLQRMQFEDFAIASVEATHNGIMDTRKLELRFADGTTIAAKWKAAPSGGEGWNNSPRREIGAYAMQRFFLDRQDYLVPPVAARCIPLDVYQAVAADRGANVEGTRCVFGLLSAWLSNVTEPDPVFDRERFARDRRYAFNLADLNLLHYLIDHRDARASNFLIATDGNDARIFSVDNGIAFGTLVYNYFIANLNDIRVSALPRQSVDRLRRITRDDLAQLGTLAQLEADSAGVLRNVPPTANVDPDSGVRVTANGLQLGLTRSEIDAVMKRLQVLLATIDAGDLGVF